MWAMNTFIRQSGLGNTTRLCADGIEELRTDSASRFQSLTQIWTNSVNAKYEWGLMNRRLCDVLGIINTAKTSREIHCSTSMWLWCTLWCSLEYCETQLLYAARLLLPNSNSHEPQSITVSKWVAVRRLKPGIGRSWPQEHCGPNHIVCERSASNWAAADHLQMQSI